METLNREIRKIKTRKKEVTTVNSQLRVGVRREGTNAIDCERFLGLIMQFVSKFREFGSQINECI